MIVTHLTEAIRGEVGELLTRQETRQLLDQLKESTPPSSTRSCPTCSSLGEIQRVLQSLLREGVSIRDLGVIVEAIGDKARLTRDPSLLAEYARQALGRSDHRAVPRRRPQACARSRSTRMIEQEVSESITATSDGEYLAMEPLARAGARHRAARPGRTPASRSAARPVLLCSARDPPPPAPPRRAGMPQLAVCSYNEIVPGISVETVGVVEG